MQWLLMLLGLLLGGGIGESIVGALFGGWLGLAIGQAIRLNRLSADNDALRHSLQDATERFEQGTEVLGRRLAALEKVHTAAPSDVPTTAQPETPDPSVDNAAQQLPEETAPIDTPAPEPAAAADPWLVNETADTAHDTAPTVQHDRADTPAKPPRRPSPIDRAIAAARDWLLGGNTVLRVGVVLLFLGLAFLLRYASERVVVPIELRYASVAASALALLAFGWWLRRRNPGYGLMLQGAGIAVLYLTAFAAMRLHPLLEPGTVLTMLVLVTACSAVLAVAQNALSLAAVAAMGGFAAPILTSTGAGDHVALFSYFALLNAGILAIAWFKAWRPLNLIGFIGTFGIGTTWGLRSYTPELFWSTEPFLVLFFLMYVVIGLLFARRTLLGTADAPAERSELLQWSKRRVDYLDATAVFGPPLVGFGLQYAVVRHIEFGAAFSALAMGLFYLLLAQMLAARTRQHALLLVEACIALGVIFATLAIPLGLDADWTASALAIEGAGIYWIGLRQGRTLGRAFALLVQAGAAVAFMQTPRPGTDTLLDGATLGALLLGVALLFSHRQLRKTLSADSEAVGALERQLLPWLAAGGLVFLYLIAPLLFHTQGTASAWALAGLATLYAGLQLRSRVFLLGGLVVQLLGGLLFLSDTPAPITIADETLVRPLMHGDFWVPTVLALTALAGGWLLERALRASDDIPQRHDIYRAAILLPIWGAAWWGFAAVDEIQRFASAAMQGTALLLAAAASGLIWGWLARRLNWYLLAQLALLPVAAGIAVLLQVFHMRYHPAADFGWLGWGALFAVHLFGLKRLDPLLLAVPRSAAHVLGSWLLIGVLALELRYLLLLLSEQYNAWRWLGWALLPGTYLWLISSRLRLPWPVAEFPREYRLWAAAPLAVLMLAWFWLANIYSDGAADPLPYIPVVNPLELGLTFTLAGIVLWAREALTRFGYTDPRARLALHGMTGLSLFALASAAVARAVHHWSDVPFRSSALLSSMQVQAGLSLVWTSIALGLMISGHRRGRRELWLVGAGLIALVVAKLFFVELGNRGGLERIVSFIGVGVLLLVVGYFAPLPPRKPQAQESTS